MKNWEASKASKNLMGPCLGDEVKDYFDTHLNATLAEVAAHFCLPVEAVKQILMED